MRPDCGLVLVPLDLVQVPSVPWVRGFGGGCVSNLWAWPHINNEVYVVMEYLAPSAGGLSELQRADWWS